MRNMLETIATIGLLIALVSCAGGGDGDGNGSGENNAGERGNAVASGSEVRPGFAFVTNGVDPFWTIAQKGAEDAERDLSVDVDVLMPAGGVVEQKRILEDLVARNIDGIAVSPIDAANQTDLINDVAGHTLLITHDSDAPQSDRICYIGMDNYDAGRMCGKLVKEAMPEGGSVFIFVGRLEQNNARGRRQGVIDELLDRSYDPTRYDPPGSGTLAGEKYTIFGTLTDQFDRPKAKANAEDALSRHPDLDCMVGLFAYNAPMCLEALRQAGKVGEVKVVAFDEQEQTLQAIKDGAVYGTVVQDPYNYGYRSMEVLKALHAGDESVIPENQVIDIPARAIRADNVDAFWADLKEKLGESEG